MTLHAVRPDVAELRPMRWWDIDTVAAIDAEVFAATAWSPATFWSELAGVPATHFYVVGELDGAIVGFGGAAFGPDDSDVQTVAVRADMQRRGIGRRIVQELIDEAVRRVSNQLFLEVRHDNEAAISLYRTLGFEQISLRKSYYGPGSDAVIMRLGLGRGGVTA